MKTRKRIANSTGVACLLLAALLLWTGGIDGLGWRSSATESIFQETPASARASHHEERVAREKRREEVKHTMESAYERLLLAQGPSQEVVLEAELEFLREMARCGEVSLSEVHRFIEPQDARKGLGGHRRWFGDVLQELAKKHPRKALDFGLALNASDLDGYSVPPRTLLGIALQRLTAEDAIRVMEIPLRDSQQYRIYSQAAPGETYHGEFDFRVLGDYIVRMEHEGEPHSWKPTTHPADFVKTWTQRDATAAEAFCRAMNDRPDGAITGWEYIDYFNQLSLQEPRSVVSGEMLRVVTDPEINFSIGYISVNWLQDSARREILMDVVPNLPAAERDAIGHDALAMSVLSGEPSAVEFSAAAMHLFATEAARRSSIETLHRVRPDASAIVRAAEDAFLSSH